MVHHPLAPRGHAARVAVRIVLDSVLLLFPGIGSADVKGGEGFQLRILLSVD